MGKKNKQKQSSLQGSSPSVTNFAKSKVEKSKNLSLQTSFSEKKKKVIKQNFQVMDSTATSPVKSGDKQIVTEQNQNTSGSPKKRNKKRNKKFQVENVTNASVSSAKKIFSPNKIEVKSDDKPLSKSARRRLKKLQSQAKSNEGKVEDYIPLVSPTKSNANGISVKKQNKKTSQVQSQTSPPTKRPKTTNTLPDKSIFSSASDDEDDDDIDEDDDDIDEEEEDDNDDVESENDDEDESDKEVNLKQQDESIQIQSKNKEVKSPSKGKAPEVPKQTFFAQSGYIKINTANNGPSTIEESSDEEDSSEEDKDNEESEDDEDDGEDEVNVKDFVEDEAEEGEESDEDNEESEDDSEGSPKKKIKYSPTEERIKRSDDVEEKNKVFINNLPPETTEEQLTQVLSKVGNITSVTLPRNKQNDEECRGFAFVQLPDKETFQKVVELDGVAEISGQTLSIREYTSRPRGGGGRGFRGGGRGGGGFRGGRGGGGFRGGRGGGGFRGGRGGGGFRGGRGGGGFRGGRGGGGFKGDRDSGNFRGGRDSGNFRGGRGGGFRGSPGGRGRGFKGGKDGASD